MSLWQDYLKDNELYEPIEDIPVWLQDSLNDAIEQVARGLGAEAVEIAFSIKRKFRVNTAILGANNGYAPRLTYLLRGFYAQPDLFFAAIDYVLSHVSYVIPYPNTIEKVLAEANHKYSVKCINETWQIAQRLSAEDEKILTEPANSNLTYAKEYADAFRQLYGPNPNFTYSAHEAFQATESALKYYFGKPVGNNLGESIAWLKNNLHAWQYSSPTKGQTNTQSNFLALLEFMNHAYRAVKHGQPNEQLTISKEHAGTILRTAALIIYQLENTIVKVDLAKK